MSLWMQMKYVKLIEIGSIQRKNCIDSTENLEVMPRKRWQICHLLKTIYNLRCTSLVGLWCRHMPKQVCVCMYFKHFTASIYGVSCVHFMHIDSLFVLPMKSLAQPIAIATYLVKTTTEKKHTPSKSRNRKRKTRHRWKKKNKHTHTHTDGKQDRRLWDWNYVHLVRVFSILAVIALIVGVAMRPIHKFYGKNVSALFESWDLWLCLPQL